jgi:hypothetical protein
MKTLEFSARRLSKTAQPGGCNEGQRTASQLMAYGGRIATNVQAGQARVAAFGRWQ